MDHKYSHNQLNRNIEHDERKQTQYVRDTSSNLYYADNINLHRFNRIFRAYGSNT
jgi:hypothetical protein